MIPEYYSFRPLSGNYISQYKQMALSTEILVSVPCRGTTFLNMIPVTRSEVMFSCFRPLSGNYISQFDRFMKEYEF